MSLYKRIFLLLSVILLLILIVMTSLVITNQRKAIMEASEHNMAANMFLVTSQLQQTVEDFTALGLSYSNNRAFTTYLKSLDLNDGTVVNEARDVAIQIKNASEILNNVTLTPRDGVIRIDALGAFFEKGPDESQLEYFRVLSSEPDKKVFINKPMIGTANNEPIFGIGIQMDNDGDFLGILGLPINLNRFMDRFVVQDIADEEIEVVMVNSQGLIVWSSDSGLILNDAANMSDQEPELFRAILAKGEGSLQQEILGIDAQINYSYFQPFDAYIIVYKDIGPYQRSLVNSVVTSVIFGLTMLFVSGIATFIVLQRVTNPIYQLVDYANRLAEDDFQFKISEEITRRNDEIGKLGMAFDFMAQSLNASFKKIQAYGKRYHFLANHDELTNLPNRRNFNKGVRFFQEMSDVGSVVMMDIDNFKNINDTMGHLVGDEVLVKVAEVLDELSSVDILVSRFGGDEFIVYINESCEKDLTYGFIRSLVEAFSGHTTIAGNVIDIKLSMGVASYPENSKDIDELIRQADIALYMAKSKGKNRVEFFDKTMEASVYEKVEIVRELTDALENDGFKVLYQPIVSLKDGSTSCYEALLRLKSNRFGPAKFIPVAEENLLVIEIGRWVVKEVIEQIVRWRREGMMVSKVSVNFSGIQLQDKDFCEYLEDLLETNMVEGRYIELEVTENVFIQQGELVNAFFKKITSLGIDLSLDDFGTGYSSLTYMISFPVKKIKLDRQLVLKYLNNNKNHAMDKLISLVHSLGYNIVAEGVEEARDIETLIRAGCDYVQGYYFSRPNEVEDMEDINKVYSV